MLVQHLLQAIAERLSSTRRSGKTGPYHVVPARLFRPGMAHPPATSQATSPLPPRHVLAPALAMDTRLPASDRVRLVDWEAECLRT